ncbi:MAG: ECF-type sigma factor, partial [Planctomycetota bacterium]
MNDWNASVEDSFPAHDDEENSIAFSVVIEDENGDERTLGIAQLIDEHRRRAKAEQTIVRNSSRDPINQLMSVAYERLQKIASHRLGYGPRQGIEESGDLLHEAWSNRINRLIADEVQVRDSSHFFALAARLIRQTLIDLHRKSTRVVRDDDGNKQRVRKHHNESSMRSDDPQRESSPMAMQADERAPSVQDRR